MQTDTTCPFCRAEDMLIRNELAYARYDKYPVNPGHLLLIPFRHVGSYFDTTPEERRALLALLDQAKVFLDRKLTPAGYNIDEAAGQTVMHVHVHLIPRYPGDVADPRGGVRGVIPAKQSY